MTRATENVWIALGRAVAILEKPRSVEVTANVLRRATMRLLKHEAGLALGKPDLEELRDGVIADVLVVARGDYPVPALGWLDLVSFVALEGTPEAARAAASFEVEDLCNSNFVTPIWMPFAVAVLGDAVTGRGRPENLAKAREDLARALEDLLAADPATTGEGFRTACLLRAALATSEADRTAALADYEADERARDGRDGPTKGVRQRVLVVEALRKALA
jgi:hypothetical protein